MAKHSAGEGRSSQPKGYKAQHRADTDSPTVAMRADYDANGRLTGFSVGRPARTDGPGTYDSGR